LNLNAVLLDKNVVRRLYEARLRIQVGRILTPAQVGSVLVFQALISASKKMYITQETYHSAVRRSPVAGETILSHITLLSKGKYLTRWARRLRELSLTREDALIVANATFGLDVTRQTLGADLIVTLDLGLIRKFNDVGALAETRLKRMTSHLRQPYSSAKFPAILNPSEALQLLESES
jgi:hypothetical protein